MMLLAQQMGTSYTGMFGLAAQAGSNYGVAMKLAGAADNVVRSWLGSRGLTANSTKIDFWNQAYFIMQILQMLQIKGDNSDGSWTANAAVDYAYKLMHGVIDDVRNLGKTTVNQYNQLVDKYKISSWGKDYWLTQNYAFGAYKGDFFYDVTNALGIANSTNFDIRSGDQLITGKELMQWTVEDKNSADYKKAVAIMTQLATGNAQIARLKNGHLGNWQEAASLLGQTALGQAEAQGYYQVDLAPGLKQYLKIHFIPPNKGGNSNSNSHPGP